MEVTRYDGTTVICIHSGAPCNGCTVPENDWPEVWKSEWTLVETLEYFKGSGLIDEGEFGEPCAAVRPAVEDGSEEV